MALALATRVGLTLGVREAFMYKGRRDDRKRLTEWAKHRAEELKRSLVILESGDKIKANSIPLKDDTGVVLVCHAFEYQDDLGVAWEEVMRVAGSASNMFVAFIPKQSFVAWLHPGAKYILDTAPPATPVMRAREIGKSYPMIACQGERKPFCAFGSRVYGS